MTEPHPLRCETCNRPIGLIGGTNDCPVSIPSHLDIALVDCMKIIGCASHSSAKESSNSKAAPSHARTSDDVLRSDAVLEELKTDIKTRFIPSNNQWSKGRNSGLIECCNIIDELLQQQKER